MAILNTNNYYQSLYTLEGLQAWVKTAEYKNTFNTIDIVVNELIITKEGSKDVLYKFSSNGNNYLCHYNSNRFFSIVNVIEDILIYLAHNTYDNKYKINTIYSVLLNSSTALLNIKLFNKEYKKQVQELKRQEEYNNINKEIEIIKQDIENTLQQISKYELIRYNKPCKINNYTHELYTTNTYKTFNFSPAWQEGIEGYNSILLHLKTFLCYLQNDYEPINFMTFDKIA